MNLRIPVFRGGRAIVTRSLGLALVGAALLVAGAFVDRERLFYAYLAAYAYAVTTAVGALIFLMICHAMNATWPVAVRRLAEAIVGALPLLAVLFLPLLFGLDALYGEWLHPETIREEHVREVVLHKQPYLNLPFFLVRTAIYFAVWLAFGALLRRGSLRGDATPALAAGGRLRVISVVGLPLVALTLSFASFDWLMSLAPTWVSTMFPVYVFAGGFVAAIALLTVLAFAAERAGLLPGLGASHYYALGRLLLAFTIFWAYAAFFQFMLIWITDRPEEIEFFLRRSHGPWRTETLVLVLARFVIPFAILLNYRIKRRPAWLSAVAAWVVAAHYLDMHWLVAPEIPGARAPLHWLDLAALLAVIGASVAFAALRMRNRPLAPINDPALPAALRYESV
ncbi:MULTISPECIES: hypothetical protein [Sorangium]|uniref:Quinol:cytochrome C oxidoreductase n=1 Tax=Sorangium cellulosum TaxID=56 RepID=A0A4P2QUD5_SORCE|nr:MULTISPECIES: hypothetical protein [Sorangium]AUX33768.1 hypothetical protein SOCE836_059320 [Sorangium cellulosum]WCQ93078.1 hypothetical protein NQZ70_05826 [Sorangium sp. Soce836]